MFLSGIGHLSYQLPDYKKHNLIFAHLSNQNWPIIQHITKSKAIILIYYIAYYLPGGLAGKLLGERFASIFEFAYALFGLSLIFYNIRQLSRKLPPILSVLSFILFSGLDVFGSLILNGRLLPLSSLESWNPLFIYQGITETLYWVPQQAIPAWLITSMFLRDWENNTGNTYRLFIWAICILWSPWVFIGLSPIVIFLTARDFLAKRKVFTLTNIIPTVMIIGVVLYYYLINANSVHGSGWVWNFDKNWFKYYFIFIVIEFLPLSTFLLWKNRANKSLPMLSIVIITLLLLPLYRAGVFNDFAMKVSTPLIALLAIFTIKTLSDLWGREKTITSKLQIGVILVYLCVGSVNGIYRVVDSANKTFLAYRSHEHNVSVYEPNLFKSFNNIPSDVILEQYLARNVDFRKYQWLFKY